MAHQLSWAIEKRVISLVYYDEVDKAEMQMVNEALASYFAAGEKPIYLLNDTRLIKRLNADLKSIVKTFTVLQQEDLAYIATIGSGTLTKFFFKTLNPLLNGKMLLFPSTEIALEALIKLDNSLKTINEISSDNGE